MTFIEKVKESVELTTGCRFFYHAAGELNEVLAGVEIGSDPIAFAYLLKGGEVAVGKNCREGVNLAVFFCKKTEFDFNSYDNEQLIDECKQLAFGWVSWFSKSNTLEIVGNVTTERVYDTTTDILTGIAVNITLRELVGYGMCDIKKPVLVIEKNGIYKFGSYDVKVEVIPKSGELVARENGTYLPSEYGVDAFNKVDVDIDPLTQCGYAEFDFATDRLNYTIIQRLKRINLSCFDTSKMTNMSSMFSYFSSLTTLDLSNFDTSNVTNMSYMFRECSSLTTLDLSNFDTSKVTNMSRMFYMCTSLTTIDFSGLDTSKVTDMSYMFTRCSSLTTLDVSKFDTSNVTDMYYMFHTCSSLTTLDVSNFDTSKVTRISDIFYLCYSLTSIIGDKSLEDVENGIVAMKGTKISLKINNSSKLRYSSMLAVTKGLADLTGQTAQTIQFNRDAWNNMFNDDDTVPTSDVIAERQARLSAIAAQKNWNIAH